MKAPLSNWPRQELRLDPRGGRPGAIGLGPLLLLMMMLSPRLTAAAPAQVNLMRTPDGGIQPHVVADSQGVAHLIYYKGESGSGDIFYARQEPGQSAFSAPIPVNSQKGSAIAAGSIRGAHLAVGKQGRVHVAWDGMGKGATQPTIDGKKISPFLYTRMNDAGTGFEPERNLITYAAGLDGGGSVAADLKGNVYAFWHAPKPGNTNGEAGRALFVARSTDEGKTFAREKLCVDQPTGACGCCGTKAFADAQGRVFALYRGAVEKVNRDEILLISREPGADFEIALAHPWKLPSCPMSSASLSEANARVFAAWETEGKIYFSGVDATTLKASEPVSPLGGTKGKHPVAVGNAQGDMLLAWTEGTGWQKGGAVAWQVYDKAGRPTPEKGRTNGVPVWSLVTAFAKPDGSFVLIY